MTKGKVKNKEVGVGIGNHYEYGFNGQLKVNEIAGLGNHNSALFWEYDTRTGRRWNKDPQPVSSVSDYAAFLNSPIWKNDPGGNSGEAYLTQQVNKVTGHPIIRVVVNDHLYGQDATQARANIVQSDNNALYNNNGNYFTTVVNGKTYDVEFEFKADVVSDAAATKGIGKLSAKDNYWEVRNDIPSARTLTGAANGGNTGALKTDDIDNGKKSDSHEENHGFAGENKDYLGVQNNTNPDIAVAQGDTNIPGQRKVTQANIDAIFKKVKFGKSGKANVGNPRPQKYDKSKKGEYKEVPVTK